VSDAISAMSATASVAQSLFGEAGGGIASRLQAALGLELARARTDAQFAAAAVASASFASSVERRSASSSVRSSLASERADGVRDTRVRVAAREHQGHRHGDADDEGRHGAVAGNEAATWPRWQVMAIERALRVAGDAARDAGCSGSLLGLLLPGALAANGGTACACTDFLLCTSFDGDLGATRRVWGFGYADTVLVATLDGRRIDAGQREESSCIWTVERSDVVDGGYPCVSIVQGGRRCIALMVADDPGVPLPACWRFVSTSGPQPC